MDPNLIPTLGGAVLLTAVWAGTLIGRAYVRRLQIGEARKPPPDDREA